MDPLFGTIVQSCAALHPAAWLLLQFSEVWKDSDLSLTYVNGTGLQVARLGHTLLSLLIIVVYPTCFLACFATMCVRFVLQLTRMCLSQCQGWTQRSYCIFAIPLAEFFFFGRWQDIICGLMMGLDLNASLSHTSFQEIFLFFTYSHLTYCPCIAQATSLIHLDGHHKRGAAFHLCDLLATRLGPPLPSCSWLKPLSGGCLCYHILLIYKVQTTVGIPCQHHLQPYFGILTVQSSTRIEMGSTRMPLLQSPMVPGQTQPFFLITYEICYHLLQDHLLQEAKLCDLHLIDCQ